VDVELFEHFQVLRGGVRRDDAGWNFIVEFFAQCLDVVDAVFWAQSEITQNEIEFWDVLQEGMELVLLVWNFTHLVARSREVLKVSISE
jgi:uncharacterized membrane protein